MPIPNGEEKLKRSLAREQVYHRLHDWIVEGTLKPGEIIRDQLLAETLGVSRTPVREALRRLEDEGLIETAKHRWTRVAPIYLERAAELYGVVRTLEIYALSLAQAALHENDFSLMAQTNMAMSEAVKQHDVAAAVLADNEFHQVWIDRADNRELARVLHELKAKLRRMEFAHFDSEDAACSVDEHWELLTALQQGRWQLAHQALERNWEPDEKRFTPARSSAPKDAECCS